MDGVRLALKLALPAIAYVAVGAVVIVIFIWSGADLWEALVAVCGGLLVFAWYVDRRHRAGRSGRADE